MLFRHKVVLIAIKLIVFSVVHVYAITGIPAVSILDTANKLYRQKEYKKSSELLIKYENDPSFTLKGNSIENFYYYKLKGNLYLRFKEYDLSVKFLLQALDISDNKPDNLDSISAYINNNLGLSYCYLGDYSNAINFFDNSIKIKKKYNFPKTSLLTTINNLAVISKKNGNFEKALSYYNVLEKILEDEGVKDSLNISSIYMNKANLCKNIYRIDEALIYYQKAINLFPVNETKYLINTYNNIGNLFLIKQEYEAAITLYLKSYNLILKNKIEPVVNNLLSLANTYSILGNRDSANYFFVKTTYAIFLNYSHSYNLTNYYIYFAKHKIRNNEFSSAQNLLQKALEFSISNYGENHLQTSKVYSSYGDYYKKINNNNLALSGYNKAIRSLVKHEAIEKYLFENPGPDKLYVIVLLNKKAELLKGYSANVNNQALLKCYQTYDLLNRFIEKYYGYYTDEKNRLAFTRDVNEITRSFLKICYRLFLHTRNKKYAERAFQVSELRKAVAIKSSIHNSNSLITANVPDSLIEKEKQISNHIIYLENQNEENQQEEYLNKLIRFYSERDRLNQFLETNYPKYYQLKYDNKSIPIKEIQNSLEKNQVLIEYTLLENSLYTFCINSDTILFNLQVIDSTFTINLSQVTAFTSNSKWPGFNKRQIKTFALASNNLYNFLLKPFEKIIQNKRVTIIPDAELNFLAFDALVTSVTENEINNFSNLPYLVYKNPVSYQSSASLRQLMLNSVSEKKRAIAAFVPHYKSSLPENKLSLNNLKAAIKEVNGIFNYYKGKKYTGEKATKENFLNQAGKYSIIHLVMHTLINPDNPLLSGLAFTNTGTGQEDSFLNTFELYNKKLNSDMVVLSTCNAGVGEVIIGEGVLNIARGFIYSGCKSLLMTLWEAHDQTSALIITSFYKYMAEGFSKDIALQKAKTDYLNNATTLQKHPFYWASFVNLGDNTAIKPVKKHYSNIVITSLVILLFIILFFFLKESKFNVSLFMISRKST